MSSPRLLFDENFDARIIEGLELRLGISGLFTVQSVGLTGAKDPAILEWAAIRGLILASQDFETMPFSHTSACREGFKCRG